MSNLNETRLFSKALGCLLGGLIGDAMGTPTEGMDYDRIAAEFGWVDDFSSDGTDDTVMKNLLAEALIRTDGYATLDDWAQVWLDNWNAIFGVKLPKFFVSVVHTAQKLKRHAVPRMAALGNMPSSSSAMCISPVGIVNACNPAQAALQAYNLAGLIHIHDVGFCQDGAAAMAAGVAEAMKLDATVESVLEAAREAIIPASGADMLARIKTMLALAREADGDFRAFCEAAYSRRDALFCRITCDSRETIPLTLALFLLGEGDVKKCVTYAANFGRDADTTGTMVGALAGALRGVEGIDADWVAKVERVTGVNQAGLAAKLAGVAMAKYQQETAVRQAFEALSSA